MNLVLNLELDIIHENMELFENFLKDKYIKLTIKKILLLVFGYNINIISIQEIYILETIYKKLQIIVLKKYFGITNGYDFINLNIYQINRRWSSELSEYINLSNNNEYYPIPWLSFIENKIILKCKCCSCHVDSKSCFKFSTLYIKKEYLSYDIYNLCKDCFTKKTLTKFKYYIGFYRDYGQFDFVLATPMT